jgi:glucan phosphoethanolaminetransferase (alkaline phosphatase superfamily)
MMHGWLKWIKAAELAAWAIWLGALWCMAILVVPGLFKWLPRPEAGLVAGRFFYMLSWYSLGSGALLLVLSSCTGVAKSALKLHSIVLIVLLVSLIELLWLHPHMRELRQAMQALQGEQLGAAKAKFGTMHAVSSVLYSIKMIAGLLWGLSRYTTKQTPHG